MPKKVNDIAQLAMDAYYLDYRPASAFFTIDHFIRFCVLADADLKLQEYRLLVNNNIRQGKKNAQVILGSDNYYTAKGVPVVNDKAVLPYPIMSFPGAGGESLNVSAVIPEGNCGNLMRITQSQRWQVCGDTDMVYWVPACEGIEFINKEACPFKKVDVTYIPSVEKGTMIQDSKGWGILTMVSGFMKAMKNGTVVDKSNDGNPNTSLQTELNKYLIEGLRT